jgi:hypothetical protein
MCDPRSATSNGIVRTEIRRHPQFGHILKSNSFRPAVSARSENNHKHLATAANPFAFTKQGNVSTPELDFARNRKQLRQPPPEGEFYANFIGMS